jgi:hypothetical protein
VLAGVNEALSKPCIQVLCTRYVYRHADRQKHTARPAPEMRSTSQVRSRPLHWAGGGWLWTVCAGRQGCWLDRCGPGWIAQSPEPSKDVVSSEYVYVYISGTAS